MLFNYWDMGKNSENNIVLVFVPTLVALITLVALTFLLAMEQKKHTSVERSTPKASILERFFQLFQKNKAKKLDPYRMGEVVGPAAFNSGDRVVILSDGNVPGVVRCRNLDFTQSIRVILGYQDDSVYGKSNYYASDLGYPLHHDLWSQTQLECYEKCHTESWLRSKWER